MKRFIPLLLVTVAIAELVVVMAVARAVGVLGTLALLLLTSIVGFWLVKAVGVGMLQRFIATTARAELPRREIVDGAILLVAGVLLVVPGFVTALAGLALLTPPVRAVVRSRLSKRVVGGAFVGSPLAARFGRNQVWETSATDVDGEQPPHPGLSP